MQPHGKKLISVVLSYLARWQNILNICRNCRKQLLWGLPKETIKLAYEYKGLAPASFIRSATLRSTRKRSVIAFITPLLAFVTASVVTSVTVIWSIPPVPAPSVISVVPAVSVPISIPISIASERCKSFITNDGSRVLSSTGVTWSPENI